MCSGNIDEPEREIHSDELIPVDANFKVSAGPGAGKTHWLVLHVKNVLRHSSRLAKTASIACITFTNTGVEELRERLGDAAERVEVATIHGFLYKAIVRPHAFLLKDENGDYLVDLKALDGHEEHFPRADLIYRWQKETKQDYLDDPRKLNNCLLDLDWHFDGMGKLELRPRNAWKSQIGKYRVRQGSFLAYKQLYWKRGRVHHEDLLYFAFKLLMENPEIVGFLCSRFPYIFVDEFQDTHPVQTRIIRIMAERGAVVGVIGDPAQSIFSFQGARRRDFLDFSLPRMERLVMRGNRRSTKAIVGLLSAIRKNDFEQNCLRQQHGDTVKLIVGDKVSAVNTIFTRHSDVVILSRTRSTAHQLKLQQDTIAEDIWDLSRSLDSDSERQDFIYQTLYSMRAT